MWQFVTQNWKTDTALNTGLCFTYSYVQMVAHTILVGNLLD